MCVVYDQCCESGSERVALKVLGAFNSYTTTSFLNSMLLHGLC